LQTQGGQLCPATQAAQAHPQPPPPVPPSPPDFTPTHVPLGHGAVTQTMPSSIQSHELAPSAAQVWASPWAAHGSAGTAGADPLLPPPPIIVAGVPPELVPPTPTLPAPHAQSQGGQVAPGAQMGHAHAQVPPVAAPPPHVPPPAVQVQAQGRQVAPGAQEGQAHVQVPPPPPLPVGGPEQSQTTAGQSAFAGQAIGCTQVQPPPEAPRAWQ
jgi:hypothetical protein